MKYNKLLNRQIKKHFGNNIPTELEALFDDINNSYDHYENDRKLLERAMDLSSEELLITNKKLKKEGKKYNQFIENLRQVIFEIEDFEVLVNELKLANDDFDYLFDYLKTKVIENKKAQKQLIESKSNLFALIENSTQPIWSLNSSHEIIAFNTAFEKKFEEGYKIKPKIGEQFGKFVYEKHLAFWDKLIEKALSGKRFTKETSYKLNKTKYYFEISLNPIIINNVVEGVSIFSRDITKNKEIELKLNNAKTDLEIQVLKRTEELLISNLSLKEEINAHKKTEKELIKAKNKAEESDKLKSSFLANMSHEIRTPLNAIVGFSSLLSVSGIDEETKDSYIKNIDKGSKSLTQLIDDIIDLSKIQAGQIEITKTEFKVNYFLKELFSKFKESATNKDNINFTLEIPENEIDFVIKTDKTRFRQILFNLISNALKFTEKGEVRVGYKINTHTLKFFVEDTGIGIDKVSQTKIFKHFTKLEEDKNKLFRGTGLGLAIVKGLAEQLSLNISMKSEKNVGSCFWTEIFITEEIKNIDRIKTEKNKHFNWSKKTILIAEDEILNYEYLLAALKKTSIKVIHAKNGKEAIELFNKNKIDLVLMDIKMPEMDGKQAAKVIREQNKVPIIAQTAYSNQDEIFNKNNCSFDDFMYKPIKINELYSKIAMYI